MSKRSPWFWIPSVYYAQGLPFAVVMMVSVILYKRLDISNTDIAFYTSWLYLPWVIKPLWSPIVDIVRTRRYWIVAMQLLIGAGFAGIALALPTDDFFRYTLAVFWLIAFSSATHDIAADGFYIVALDDHQQAWFVGFRSTFFRLAMITGQGLLVMIAGYLESSTGNVTLAWSLTFYLLAAVFLILFAWHRVVLPAPADDVPSATGTVADVLREAVATFVLFFRKDHIGRILAFLLLYRFAEAQLVKLSSPFLLDSRAEGGLELGTVAVGVTYGTIGVLMLTAGGILGGIVAARYGLKRCLWWMVAAINLPNAAYLLLAVLQSGNIYLINAAVAIEQFGYGFGFTAYLLYMIYIARGQHSTAHYAICTGFMSLGMMLPGMASGWLQEWLGYQQFFAWVLLATIPSFLVVRAIPLDNDFAKRRAA
jgi:MFS transporter, PAT family, beta-lactamase induction signal transducer AmpG